MKIHETFFFVVVVAKPTTCIQTCCFSKKPPHCEEIEKKKSALFLHLIFPILIRWSFDPRKTLLCIVICRFQDQSLQLMFCKVSKLQYKLGQLVHLWIKRYLLFRSEFGVLKKSLEGHFIPCFLKKKLFWLIKY